MLAGCGTSWVGAGWRAGDLCVGRDAGEPVAVDGGEAQRGVGVRAYCDGASAGRLSCGARQASRRGRADQGVPPRSGSPARQGGSTRAATGAEGVLRAGRLLEFADRNHAGKRAVGVDWKPSDPSPDYAHMVSPASDVD